jgi:NAD(P)-dependent dehydrogenase (short-subunit alcohol dehydrogenase family)
VAEAVEGPLFDLSGKVALVTGAGLRGGRGIARMLGRQGASVVVNDIVAEGAERVAGEIRQAGGQASAQAFDVTDEAAVIEGVAAAAGRVGPIDILVNNAGNGGALGMSRKPFLELSHAEWERIAAVNLFGVTHCTRAVLPAMRDRGWGRIITISSGMAVHSQTTGYSHYGAAKAGGLSLMRHIAAEFGPHGITANAVVLGLISEEDNDMFRSLAARLPARRRGLPEDLAALCVFLASREAGWLTAQSIHLNGGQYGT